MSSLYISLDHSDASTFPLSRRWNLDLFGPIIYGIWQLYRYPTRILGLLLSHQHLSLIVIEAHAHQEYHEDTDEAADQSEVPKELKKEPSVAEGLILVEGVPQEVPAV